MAKENVPWVPIGVVGAIVCLVGGVLLFKSGGGEAGATGSGGVAVTKGPGVLAGAHTFTILGEEPAVRVTVKLPGAKKGEFRPMTVSMMNIPIKLEVLATGLEEGDAKMSAVARTWCAQVSATRSDALFLPGTKKVVGEVVKLADGTVARVSYGSGFMAPSLTAAEDLPRDLENKGVKAFQVLVTSDKGELFVTLMGPVERGAELEPMAVAIAESMRIEEVSGKSGRRRE